MADKLNYKVSIIGALDMLKFKNMPKVREAAIQAAPATPLPKTLTTNEKAKLRTPKLSTSPSPRSGRTAPMQRR